jgi:hypothetical protein
MRPLEVGVFDLEGRAEPNSSHDADPTNNNTRSTITVTTSTPGVDLSIVAKDPNPLLPPVGTDFAIGWVVRNHGASTAPGGATVTITLPAGVTFRSGNAVDGPACVSAPPLVTCTITPAMTSGQNEAGTVVLRSSTSGAKNVAFVVGPVDALPANNSVTKVVAIP